MGKNEGLRAVEGPHDVTSACPAHLPWRTLARREEEEE